MGKEVGEKVKIENDGVGGQGKVPATKRVRTTGHRRARGIEGNSSGFSPAPSSHQPTNITTWKREAICALVSDEWIRIDTKSKENRNVAQLDDNSSVLNDNYFSHASPFVQADRCKGVGIRHFLRTAKFGSFVDVKGVYHTTYHFDGKVLVDCITPLVANLFYILIAFCFVIVVKSTLACILSIISTSSGFLNWLKRNTILEMSSMVLAVLACIVTVVMGIMIYSVNSFSGITIGAGSVLIAVSGVSSFFATVASLQRKYRVARLRRLENQRLLCSRSLRSWREVVRHPEDMRPIVDFERYLDSWATL